jgi:hypothetical protein
MSVVRALLAAPGSGYAGAKKSWAVGLITGGLFSCAQFNGTVWEHKNQTPTKKP